MLTQSKLDPASAVVDEICPAGEPWMKPIRKGQMLRIVDLEGNQAVDTLFYNAHDPEERYSAVDTLQRQGNLYLTTGTGCYSTDGNADAHHRGRHLRPPRHARRRLRAGEQHRALRAREALHARLPRQLPVGDHARPRRARCRKRDITHNINFFMNVPVTPGRRTRPSRTASRRRASTSSCAPRWT